MIRAQLSKLRPLVTIGLVMVALILGGILIRKWLLEEARLKVSSEESLSNVPPATPQKNATVPSPSQNSVEYANLSRKQMNLLQGHDYEARDLNNLLSGPNNGNAHYTYLYRIVGSRKKAALQAYLESFPKLPDSLIQFLDLDVRKSTDLLTLSIGLEDDIMIRLISNSSLMDGIRQSKTTFQVKGLITRAVNTDDVHLLRSIWHFPVEASFYDSIIFDIKSVPSFSDEYMEYICQLTAVMSQKLADYTFKNVVFRTALLKSDSQSWANAFSKCSIELRLEILPKAIEAKNKLIATAVCTGSFVSQGQFQWTYPRDRESFRDPADELNAVDRIWPGTFDECLPKVKPVDKLMEWCEGDLLNCDWFNHRERLGKWIKLCRERFAENPRLGLGGRNILSFVLQGKPWLIGWLDDNQITKLPDNLPEIQFYRAVKERNRVRIMDLAAVQFGQLQARHVFAPELFLIQERYEDGLRAILTPNFVFNNRLDVPAAMAVAFRVCRNSEGKLEPTIPLLIAEHGAIQTTDVLWQLIADDAATVLELIKEKQKFRDATAKFLPQVIVMAMSKRNPAVARELFAALMNVEQDKRLDKSTEPASSLDEFLVSLQNGLLPVKTTDLCAAAIGSPELIEDMLLHGIQFSFTDILFAVERKSPKSLSALIQDPGLRSLTDSQMQLLKDRAKTRGDKEIAALVKSLE